VSLTGRPPVGERTTGPAQPAVSEQRLVPGGTATAALGPFVPLRPRPTVTPLMRSRLGTLQVRPLVTPAGPVRHGGARLPRPPCTRCLNCPCQTNRDFSEAQRPPSPPPRRPFSPIRPPTPPPPHTRTPKREPSPPPQLAREDPQIEIEMSWDEAQASFSRVGSPLPFLEAAVCDDILADMRQPDGTLPDFGSIPASRRHPLHNWRWLA